MAKKLYSVCLSRHGLSIIYDSLKEFLEITYQRSDVRQIVDILIEIAKVLDNGHRVYLSSGDWLIILSALRHKYFCTDVEQFNRRLIIKLTGRFIANIVYKYEGEMAFTYVSFRFFYVEK